MATGYCRSEIHNDVAELTADVQRNLKMKSSNFVRLNGPSQSERDRKMNDRPNKPPKNLILLETDPSDIMEPSDNRKTQRFPNEFSLSSKIKEVNGLDYSNHAIEEYFKNTRNQSDDPEASTDSVNSLDATTCSDNSKPGSSSCINDNCSMASNLPADQSNLNHLQFGLNSNQNSNLCDNEAVDKCLRECRYSKNAAIIGLLKNKLISPEDLDPDVKNNKSRCSGHHSKNMKCFSDNKNGNQSQGGIKNSNESNVEDLNGQPNERPRCPQLVPHPEDPDFYAHPLQAHGKVDDADIDFRLPRLGVKNIITPRQHFIQLGLDENAFTFRTNNSNS